MKKIIGIDDKLEHFNETTTAEAKSALPCYRQMFVQVLASVQANNGEQALDMYSLAMKLKGAKGPDVELENAEVKLLQVFVEKNPLGWLSFYHAQILLKLKSSDEVKS